MKTKEADSISGMVIWVSANLGMMALFCFWATNGTLDVGAVPLGIQVINQIFIIP